jgi:5-methylcytosine-specific restriction endonuclease McrA
MSSHIPAALLREVRKRARNTCEYCHLPQASQEATFHVDHIRPVTKGGPTTLENLALACVTCSLRKAARMRARDPRSGRAVRLFNPRANNWDKHFGFTRRWRMLGKTATGRATVAALGMNRPAIVAIRSELASLGGFPVA